MHRVGMVQDGGGLSNIQGVQKTKTFGHLALLFCVMLSFLSLRVKTEKNVKEKIKFASENFRRFESQ